MDKLKLYLIPLWFFLASTWLNAHGQAGAPPTDPILRLDTGMHTGSIESIGVDADEQFVLTASRDKTLRLWDMKTGQLLHIYRVPIAEVYEGQLYSGAISPDGRWVAAGGWTGYTWDGNHSIYIFDRQSGRLVQRLQGLGNAISHLCFAPQGHYLAATLGGKNGLRVYSYNDAGTFRQVAADSDYAAHSGRCQFDNSGRLVTTSYDGYVRLYDPQFQLLVKKKVPGGNQPYGAAFSPDGQRIAVGFDGSPQISVLSGKDLHLLYQPDTTSIIHGDVAILAWSSDGEYLYGGGHYAKNEGYLISRWSQGGRGEVVERPVASSTLKDIWPLKNGGVIVAAADPALVALHKQGTERWSQVPSIADR